jgi:hypothetical protein
MSNRRNFFRNALAWGTAAMIAVPKLNSAEGAPPMVQTPDVPNVPHTMDNGVKVFHLIAEPVTHKISPFKTITAWGYMALFRDLPFRSPKVTGCGSFSRI